MKHILLLDVGNQFYRSFTLASLARQAPVILVGKSLPEWAERYVAHWVNINPEQIDEIATQVETLGIDLPDCHLLRILRRGGGLAVRSLRVARQ